MDLRQMRLLAGLHVCLMPFPARMSLADVEAGWPDDCLDDGERSAAAAFVHERDRVLYTLSHRWLRHLLSAATGESPASIRFARGASGKPRLADASSSWRFSLSHTHSCVAIALSAHGEVGVDVERIGEGRDTDALHDMVLHPAEKARLREAGTAAADMFFRLWTCKEAYAKLRGLGLSLPFDRLDVDVGDGGPVLLRDETGSAAGMIVSHESRRLRVRDGSRDITYALALSGEGAQPVSFHVLPFAMAADAAALGN